MRPGYKQTEVGAIPEQWDVNRLEELGTWKGGMTPSMKNPTFWFNGNVPWISSGDVKSVLLKETGYSITTTAVKQGTTTLLPAKAIVVVTRSGILRKYLPVAMNVIPMAINQDIKALIPAEKFYPTFLLHALIGNGPRILSRCLKAGTTVESVEFRWLKAFNIPVPPPPEQRAIAEALSDADAFSESLEQLLAKKRQLKQGAMQELLTGKKRLPGFEEKPGHKQTEVGVIPEDWKPATLSTLSSMKSGEGITSANIDQFSKYPCYGGNGLRGFTTRFTHDGRYALVGRQGALCGNVVGVEGKFFASEHAIVVTASPRTDIKWLTFVLGKMHLNQYSESSAQPGLSVSKILSLNIACPPSKAEQTAIAAILSDMDVEIDALEAKLTKSRQLKQGMMQELLTGRIRLV